MVTSMTGYGRSVSQVGDGRLTVEVRSVNHRFLDLSTKMPRNLLFLEDTMKKLVTNHILRGRVDIFVTIEGKDLVEKKLEVDWDLVDQYVKHLQEIKDRYDLTGTMSIDIVTKLEDLFQIQEVDQDEERVRKVIIDTLEDALTVLTSLRQQEGDALRIDLEKRLKSAHSLVAELEKRRKIVSEDYRERIKTRIEEYVREDWKLEDTRILQEVALLAEKGDISEEVTRMYAHLDLFAKTMEEQGSIGRRLDFVVQEMHREVNTIGSKSNDMEINHAVVSLKSEIEKMKEQVQNIE
ncbi:YicC/YloC family endoribonuclease [Thalassobacillus hwangdonensis]